jgi:hypothetical protein
MSGSAPENKSRFLNQQRISNSLKKNDGIEEDRTLFVVCNSFKKIERLPEQLGWKAKNMLFQPPFYLSMHSGFLHLLPFIMSHLLISIIFNHIHKGQQKPVCNFAFSNNRTVNSSSVSGTTIHKPPEMYFLS